MDKSKVFISVDTTTVKPLEGSPCVNENCAFVPIQSSKML